MIPVPHGGHLVNAQLAPERAARRFDELRALPKLWPEIDQLYDAEKIGTGAYSPLEGFMNRTTLEAVLTDSRLPSSLPWPMPIILTPPGGRNRQVIDALRPGDEVALLDGNNRFIAIMTFEERFPLDRSLVARATYGTTDPGHPNVADLERTGDTVLAGPIRLVSRPDTFAPGMEKTPAEMRALFAGRHWGNVVAYQTRNVPHRAHEHLQRLALEREEIDGLLIHPVVGRLKTGDYRPEIVIRAYEALIQNYFPTDRVVLSTLTISMRYAGPKAALFLAIVRKNFGCSHYIVGRDQAGVARYYDPYDCHRIFDDFPIGIVPLRFREFFFCRRCDEMASAKTCPHSASAHAVTSQTRIRRAIAEGTDLPTELLRPEIVAILSAGKGVLNDAERVPLPTRGGDRGAVPDGEPPPTES
jgi:sulfate adenylyltransferase